MADAKPKKNRGTFKPGQSGNPRGRQKGEFRLSEVLRLDAQVVLTKFGKRHNKTGTRAELLSQILWEMALKGNLRAIELILDRTDGKPVTPLHHTGDADIPLLVERIIERDSDPKPDNTDPA